MASITDIKSEADFEEQLSSTTDATVLVLNFHTPWAAPCSQMQTILTTLAASYPASPAQDTAPALSILNINAEDLPDVSERYDVSAVPYLVLLRGGGGATNEKKVLETVSGCDATKVRETIERHAGKPGQGSAGSSSSNKQSRGATALPPAQQVEKPASPPAGAAAANGGSVSKDLSAYAPKQSDPATAPQMTATATSEMASKEELHARLASLVAAAPVMLFMKGTPSAPQCGFSRQLVGLLRDKGVRYGFFNILADEEVRQGLKEFADWPTFPQLWVGAELVGGLDIVKEEIANDPDFLKDYSVHAQGGGGGGGGPGAADAKIQAPETPAPDTSGYV